MFFVPHFGHAKVYETSIWTPCFQISAKTLNTGLIICWHSGRFIGIPVQNEYGNILFIETARHEVEIMSRNLLVEMIKTLWGNLAFIFSWKS